MMEYKRLTDKEQLKKTSCYNCNHAGAITCERYCADGDDFELRPELERLAELEDKIEQGTLKEIPEGAVVLTNEEFWKLSNKFSKKELDEIVEFHKSKVRKETVEKFAEMAKEGAFVVFMGEPIIRASKIDEIAKDIVEGSNE